jgi:hypothetical protein
MSALPLRVSSLVAREIHAQNKIVFSNPPIVLTGSNTLLLFNRIHTLENEVADLQANGGGGGGPSAPEIAFPSLTINNFTDLADQLAPDFVPTIAYNTFARFSYSSTVSTEIGQAFDLPNANSETHFRILNETDLSVFPLTTTLLIQYTNSDNSVGQFSMSSELISARKPKDTWVFYGGS